MMDGSLPSYEAAMRQAREYLHRRDLSSQDEIPLYFAWQRLYAAANANLSTDFLQENRDERRIRQEARLAPRRGVPPPLFTSFDKVHRMSAQSSAFLRSGTSSDAAIEMMARRYRREAEKLRSSREKLVSSLDDAEKQMKRVKRRQKSPIQEVEELLKGPEALFETENLLTTKNFKDRLTSDAEMKPPSRQISLKPVFEKEFAVDSSPVKAAEVRRSSLSKPQTDDLPSVSAAANVAAFAARVVDWRMPPEIDRASSAPELSQKGGAFNSIKGGKRLSGANELRESAPVEAEMTLDTSLENSGVDNNSFDADTSLHEELSRVSPMARHSTNHGGVDQSFVHLNAKQTENVHEPSQIASDADENPIKGLQILPVNTDEPVFHSEFHQKLVQLSHALGDMQVKIHGNQIKVTFNGELDDNIDDNDEAFESIKSDETTQPSVAQQGFDTAKPRALERDSSNHGTQIRNTSKVSRKQSNVKFADIFPSRGDDNNSEDQYVSDHTPSRHEQQNRGASAAIPPAIYEGQARQIQRTSTRENTATRAAGGGFILEDEETKQNETSRERRRPSKKQRPVDNDEDLNTRADSRKYPAENHRMDENSTRERRSESSHHRSHSSGRGRVQSRTLPDGQAEGNAEPLHASIEYDVQSFSDASEDESDAPFTSKKKTSSRHVDNLRPARRKPVSRTSSSREVGSKIYDLDPERMRTPRHSRKQLQEVRNNEFYSDEELSEGPDVPYNHHETRLQSTRQKASKRYPSRSVSSTSNDRSRRISSNKFSDSDVTNYDDVDSRDEQNSDEPHRSRPHYSKTRDGIKREIKSKIETKSSKVARKLPEGIVWPPGMEKECIARLGLDGQHPMAPPGLEHLVTEEQWGDYWTWLHWYSSWQMWYMKNDKKPKRKSEKDKISRRRTDMDDFPDNEVEFEPRNANWWVDVAPSKHKHRRDRYR